MQTEILKRTSPPAVLPVDIVDAKLDLRVDHDAEDSLIESLISAATDYLEPPRGIVGKAFITQTWELATRRPDTDSKIYLPVTPVQSVSSITYYDTDNIQQTLDVNDFHLYGDENWAFITPKEDIEWPCVEDRLDAIAITFVAGYGDATTDVPETARQLIRLLVVHWFTNRSAVNTGTIATQIPMAAQALISVLKKGWSY